MWAIQWLWLLVLVSNSIRANAQNATSCEYENRSFVDAIPGNSIFGDTSIFKQAIKLSGYEDKLPDPSSNIAITILVPTNGAWFKLLGGNWLFLPSITSFGDDLPATVLFNTMLGSVSPDQVSQYTRDNKGSAPSIYGLLSGKPGFEVQYWAEEKDGRQAYYFGSQVNDEVAETFRPVQVCNSWMYLTNRVLVPAESKKLNDVEKVTLPENLPWGPSSSPSPSPSPSPAVPDSSPSPVLVQNSTSCVIPAQNDGPMVNVTTNSPVPSATSSAECNTTFQEAAQGAGLTLLSLVASNVQGALPDPAMTSTVFAPTDGAFTGMLSDLGLTIPDALTLGDKLISVLLYHVHPGESLSVDELNQRESLTTELGVRMNDPGNYMIGVQPGVDGAPPTLVSKRGDVATISNTIQVCGTTVHVIDKVLLPASTVDELPIAPPPAVDEGNVAEASGPVTSSDSQQQTVLDKGIVVGIGPFQSCTVVLEAAGSTLTTVTDESGGFSFPNIPSCAINGGSVSLLRGSQGAECADKTTGLPPAYDLTVSLALMRDFIPSTDAPLLISPLSTLLSSPTLPNTTVAKDLGFDSDQDMVLGGNASQLTADNRIGINSQALTTALLLGTTVQGFDGVELQTGVDAINDYLAANLREKLSLADPSTTKRILNATLLNPGNEVQLDAIASTTAALNQVLVDTWYTESSILASSYDEKLNVTAQVVVFSQQELAPAILDVTAGRLSDEEFAAGYGADVIRRMFEMPDSSALATAPVPVPALLPATPPRVDRVEAASSGRCAAASLVLCALALL